VTHTRRAALQRIIAFGLAAVGCGGPATSGSRAPEGRDVLAILGARIYPSPSEPPIANGAVIATDGLITSVGPRDGVRVPAGATVLDGAGLSVTAGFWNTHVHFTEAKWRPAESVPAAELTAALRAMLTRWGVVRVVDTGSLPPNTLALRRRIESGEVAGPQIMLASGSFVPVNGSPFYLLPSRLPELTSPEQAERAVDWILDLGGIDAIISRCPVRADHGPGPTPHRRGGRGAGRRRKSRRSRRPRARSGHRHPSPRRRAVHDPAGTHHLRARAIGPEAARSRAPSKPLVLLPLH